MSGLPVSSRLKAPTSRLAKPGAAKSDGVVAPRASGLKPPSTGSAETPLRSGLKQPLLKRSGVTSEAQKTEKRSTIPSATLSTPRSKQNGAQSKLKSGLQPRESSLKRSDVSSQESLSSNLKRASSSSHSSLGKESPAPVLTREKTQESIKDLETGILFKVGDRVLVAGTKQGVIEYLGETRFAKGLWAGVKLDEAEGKNDGSVAGVRYFDCEPLHGVFSKPNRLHKINIVPKSSVSEQGNLDDSTLKIGDMVIVSGAKMGTLRYLGPTEFAKGEWAGVELDEPQGKNDGAVAGTRYFTCEMKYGLFAPSSKVTKSKKKILSKKPSNLPGLSLDSAAKSVFRTTSMNSDISDVTPAPAPVLPETPNHEKDVSPNKEVTTSNESLHSGVRKTQSNSQQVAALQSALEEREKEIHKMLMERELEKAEKLKQLELHAKDSGNEVMEQLLKEKDDIIMALKNNLQESRKETAIIQTKLDEEKKKYEDLQFMLEEEKITDDELKTHVKEDEDKIKELSSQYEERNQQIIELQKELREVRSDKISNEAKMMELRDQLAESRTKFKSIKNDMKTPVEDGNERDSNEQERENVKKELEMSREMLDEKEKKIKQLEENLNKQLRRLEQMEEQNREMNERLTANKIERQKATDDNEKIKQLIEELAKIKHGKFQIESNLKMKDDKLQALEKKYKDLMEENVLALDKKDEASKANIINLNTRISELEGELMDSKATVSRLESNMALESDIANQKTKQLENLVATTNKQLQESKEETNKKTQLVNELEHKLNTQLTRQKEVEMEVESLGQADRNLTLMKEAHRSEVNALQSKVASLEQTVNDLQNKQSALVQDFSKEIELLETTKNAEINKLRKTMNSNENKKSDLVQNHNKEIELLETTKNEEMNKLMERINAAAEEKKKLEYMLEAKNNEINKLQSDQLKLHERSQELEGQVSNLKKKMGDAAVNASNKTETLKNDLLILKEDFEDAKTALKQKEDEVRVYKEQIEKMGNDDFPKSPMDGDILENASALMLRLHEAESKLAVVQSEKETAEEQVEFLNSIIVDLQNKNQKANHTIALLEAGDEAILLHELESESDEELMAKPKYAMRKFCDICDVFDEHETDECPLQETGENNGGVQHHGDRNHERPYCGICEVFGHWSEDCNDEQTF